MTAVKEQAQSAAIQSSEQTLEFLKSYSVSSFKEETGFSEIEIKKNPNTGKMFMTANDQVIGAVSSKCDLEGKLKISEVQGDEDSFYLLHNDGGNEAIAVI